MKNTFLFRLSAVFAGLTLSLATSFSVMAAVPAGTLEGADNTSIYGWAWDSDDYNHVIPIEVSVYPEGSSNALKTDTVKADHYQDKLQQEIGDGYHGFSYSIDWSQFDQTQLRVTTYAVTETERVFLGELTYNKETNSHTPVSNTLNPTLQSAEPASPGTPQQSEGPISTQSNLGVQTIAPTAGGPGSSNTETLAPGTASGKESKTTSPSVETVPTSGHSSKYWEYGPGVTPKEEPVVIPEGVSLGMFTVTGYCNCDLCCSGSKLTYSGTVPQANHTVSADINLFPIGTRLKINDIIYTVEDIGSNVVENKIDIYYDTHEEALAHGTQQLEVFTVPEA